MMRSILLATLLAACTNEPVPFDPSPPPLGARMFDRTGRAAVSTALIGILMPCGEKDVLQERYNTAAPETWSSFAQEIAANLAVYDAFDGVCGNQVLAGPNPSPDRYGTLAGALADDQLYVNTEATACTTYLAVELNATQVAPNQDCGGRTPTYDVIDATYSALAVGALDGVPDGIPQDAKPPGDTFPFFAR